MNFGVQALEFDPAFSVVKRQSIPFCPALRARTGIGLGAVNGKLYAIGGFNGSFLATNEAFTPPVLYYIHRKN